MYLLTPGIQRHWVFKNGNRLIFERGYSIGLNKQKYSFSDQTILFGGSVVQTSDLEFTDTSKRVIKLISPEGITLSLSFMFGLNN